MKLFHVKKEDYHGKYDASYIVRAATEEAALIEVELTYADLKEMNKNESFYRYSVSVEEIDLEDSNYYRLDLD